MHILVLPSWYPYERQTAGSFIKDQIDALTQNPSIVISFINWGPNEFVLKLREPFTSIKKCAKLALSIKKTIYIKRNLTEYKVPYLTWTSYIGKGNYCGLVNKLIKQIKVIEAEQGKIDIIHAHVTFPAGFLAMQLARHTSLPFVITEHSGPFPFKEYMRGSAVRDIITEPLHEASAVIAVSSWLAESLQRYSAPQSVIIQNSVDTDYFHPLSEQCSHGDKPALFTLSQLTVPKGISDLLEAVRIMSDQGYRFNLRIGGSGKQRRRFIKLAEQLRIVDKVTWLGELSRAEALREYQTCDFYVMPSRLESLSMVILEAMACGKPIVATDCGGPRDLVGHNQGVLAKANDPVSLAESIRNMLSAYSVYDSSLIRQECVNKYSHTVISNQIIEVYKNILVQKK
jgi:glycosyltransferase involved in cell wall biosynthesis